jgi:DNA mismatch repair ATPase MutL
MPGTTVEVRDLFYSNAVRQVVARRRALRKRTVFLKRRLLRHRPAVRQVVALEVR